jgi:HK97 family phage major capsid protein
MEVKELTDKIEQAQKGVQELVQKQAGEIKKFGETTDATAKALAAAEKKLDDSMKAMTERVDQLEAKSKRFNDNLPGQLIKATPGMQFAISEEVKNRNGVNTQAHMVGNIFGCKTINPLVGDGADRAPVFSERVSEMFFDPGQRELRLRDLMNVAATTSNAVEYFMEKDFNPAGAKSQNGEGAAKQKLAMNFEKKTAAVETIAAWIPASRQVLDDQSMLQSYVDGRLLYAVETELERQVLFGDGTDGELVGIMSTPGINNVGAPSGTDTILDHIRKAIAKVRVSEYGATGIILHPNDFAALELLKGSDKHYIWVTVPNGGETRLWRVPVVESTVMTEGAFLTGAFGLGAQLWDRMQSTIRTSDSHAEYFTNNLVAILAEVRAALTVYRPKAFAKGLFGGSVSP